MEFREFAQLLHPIIGGASSTHKFVKTLFETIVTNDGLSILEEITEETYKAYFNGNTGISRLAKKISPYIEPEEFVQYFEHFSDATMTSLCNSFRPYLPEITPYNAGELLADLFQEIIKNAASAKRIKITKSTGQAIEYIEAEVMDGEEPSDAAEENTQTDTRVQIINNPTIVNQYGEKNIHIDRVDTLNL